MSALRSTTARLLLDRVSDQDRIQLVRQVASSLDAQSGRADVELTAALLAIHVDHEARRSLLNHLQALVEQDDQDQVAAVCIHHPELAHALLEQTSTIVGNIAAESHNSQRQRLAVITEHNAPGVVSTGADAESSEEALMATSSKAVQYLRLAVHLPISAISDELFDALLDSCLVLVRAKHKTLSTAAQETVLALLATERQFTPLQQQSVWSCVHALVQSSDVNHKTVGFSLWLRWLTSQRVVDHSVLMKHMYWDLLVDGLRNGDSERRKAAVSILRASVSTCVQDPALLDLVATKSPHDTGPAEIQHQYTRYCTVFETIVLGRYLNQVLECEADLDYLASSCSRVKPIWLYTMLDAALYNKLAEANRRFIGTWVMTANLRIDDDQAYLNFFREAFLPWVTGGHMFTSTLRNSGGLPVCEHGNKLSAFIHRLLLSSPSVASGTVDAILASILSRQANNFAYAMVYLIDGIRSAYQSSNQFSLSIEQLESIARIPTWAGLPEIARDCILASSWQLCHTYQQRRRPDTTEIVEASAQRWKDLLHRAQCLPHDATAHVDGNLASMALERSRRDKHESVAIQKVLATVHGLRDGSEPLNLSSLEAAVEEIWEDVDYLEYPLSLLIVLPELVPDKVLIEAALTTNCTSSKLDALLSQKVLSLLTLAQHRTYLLPPLVTKVRDVSLAVPGSASILPMVDFIVGLAEHPPTATIDSRLEDATIPMLQKIHPDLRRFDRNFYLGPRESYGFAALLDLSARMHGIDDNLAQHVSERILNRWTNQKTPAPSVSTWKTTLQLQVLLLGLEQYIPQASAIEAKSVLRDLCHNLSIEPLPRYRYLLEWMIVRTYMHHPQLRSSIVDKLRTKDHHANPKFLASLMKLGVTIAKLEDSDEAFAWQLASVFVPMAASSKVIIRHEAQWQIPKLMDLANERNWSSITHNDALKELDDYIRSLERFGDPPLDRQIDRLDPVKDHNLTHLAEGPWQDLDQVGHRQTSHDDFLKLYAADKTMLPPSCMTLGEPIKSKANEEETIEYLSNGRSDAKIMQNIENISRALSSGPDSSTALQTKGAAYLSSTRTRHNSLLVVASLVDNPYNLGGLSRVSEIFGAGGLYIPNTQVTSNKDFTSTAVSSHLHFPIHQLKGDELAEWLATKKREEHFKVVGIEQTDRSVILGDQNCVLPKKCILVLGSEREGIPALVLSECDVLVEIRQIGITRSLNVQTAAGIVLNEYARQHTNK